MISHDHFLLNLQGKIFLNKGHVNKAINIFKKIEQIHKVSNDYINLFRINCGLALFFSYDIKKGKYDIKRSKKYLSKAKLYQDYVPLEEKIIFLFTEAYFAKISHNIDKTIELSMQIDALTSNNLSYPPRLKFIRLISLTRLGIVYRDIGEIDKAIIFFNKALKESNKNDSYTYYIKNNLAEAYLFKGEISEGIVLMEEVDKWIHNGNFSCSIEINSINISLCKCFLYFNEEHKIQKAQSYLKQSYDYLINMGCEQSIDLIEIKRLSAAISAKKKLFSYAINLYKEIINEQEEPFLKKTAIVDYIFTLLSSCTFEETIKIAENYLNEEIFCYPYQKLQVKIYLCAAYLKDGKDTGKDNGIALLKTILDECTANNNEYLIIVHPEVLEILLPAIFEIDESIGLYFWEKTLKIYKCNIKPYLLNKSISAIPAFLNIDKCVHINI